MTSLVSAGSRRDPAGEAIDAGAIAWRHIRAEYVDDNVEGIVATLATDGPYGMTYNPELDGEGNPYQRVTTTRQGIADYYAYKKSLTRTLVFHAYNELRSTWYAFEHGIVEVLDKSDGRVVPIELIALFPLFGRDGITGELTATRDMALWGGDPAVNVGGPALRLANLQLHDQLLQAFRTNDADALMKTMADHVQTDIRDYVGDTGTVTELHGASEARVHYEQLFSRMRVLDVDFVSRLTEEWFIFSELRWQVEIDGRPARLLTAEFCKMGGDGRIELRIGHGTDPDFTKVAPAERGR
jgi:hypothetical protein